MRRKAASLLRTGHVISVNGVRQTVLDVLDADLDIVRIITDKGEVRRTRGAKVDIVE